MDEAQFMKMYGDLIKTTASSLGLSDTEYDQLMGIYKGWQKTGNLSMLDEKWMQDMFSKYVEAGTTNPEIPWDLIMLRGGFVRMLLIFILLFSCFGLSLFLSYTIERQTYGYIMSKFKGDASILGKKITQEVEEYNTKNKGCWCGSQDFEEWRTGSDGIFTMVHTYQKCKKCGSTHNSTNPRKKRLYEELEKAGINSWGRNIYWWSLGNFWGAVVGTLSLFGVAGSLSGLLMGWVKY